MDTPKTKARLYVPSDFLEGQLLTLSAPQSHYLIHVLRVKLSDVVRVFNGRQGEWLATTHNLTKKEVTLKLINPLRPQSQPFSLGLIFAPIRHSRLDLMIEKATELGTTDFYPILTTFTQVHKINADRLLHLAIEAAEQSEQLTVPTFHPLHSLTQFLSSHHHLEIGFCDETGTGKPLRTFGKQRLDAFLIGPEGGFSPEERTLIKAQSNTHPITLGPTILRAETAAIAAIAGYQTVIDPPHELY